MFTIKKKKRERKHFRSHNTKHFIDIVDITIFGFVSSFYWLRIVTIRMSILVFINQCMIRILVNRYNENNFYFIIKNIYHLYSLIYVSSYLGSSVSKSKRVFWNCSHYEFSLIWLFYNFRKFVISLKKKWKNDNSENEAKQKKSKIILKK